jgi:hypothetical protein
MSKNQIDIYQRRRRQGWICQWTWLCSLLWQEESMTTFDIMTILGMWSGDKGVTDECINLTHSPWPVVHIGHAMIL